MKKVKFLSIILGLSPLALSSCSVPALFAQQQNPGTKKDDDEIVYDKSIDDKIKPDFIINFSPKHYEEHRWNSFYSNYEDFERDIINFDRNTQIDEDWFSKDKGIGDKNSRKYEKWKEIQKQLSTRFNRKFFETNFLILDWFDRYNRLTDLTKDDKSISITKTTFFRSPYVTTDIRTVDPDYSTNFENIHIDDRLSSTAFYSFKKSDFKSNKIKINKKGIDYFYKDEDSIGKAEDEGSFYAYITQPARKIEQYNFEIKPDGVLNFVIPDWYQNPNLQIIRDFNTFKENIANFSDQINREDAFLNSLKGTENSEKVKQQLLEKFNEDFFKKNFLVLSFQNYNKRITSLNTEEYRISLAETKFEGYFENSNKNILTEAKFDTSLSFVHDQRFNYTVFYALKKEDFDFENLHFVKEYIAYSQYRNENRFETLFDFWIKDKPAPQVELDGSVDNKDTKQKQPETEDKNKDQKSNEDSNTTTDIKKEDVESK
ncbi:hypothetical protein [Mycoplasma procyoni]|uniref:hypothetical protein n=1 Tax=Mycoplasma procyoni TaxID=568784 RepID=UPI00197C2FEC|nr:hypothetical protein [Mycoplasma procyoni]MBN3534388.1 hypothetical protein [Mycoplasma procyoni]